MTGQPLGDPPTPTHPHPLKLLDLIEGFKSKEGNYAFYLPFGFLAAAVFMLSRDANCFQGFLQVGGMGGGGGDGGMGGCSLGEES